MNKIRNFGTVNYCCVFFLILSLFSCQSHKVSDKNYQTKYVITLVIDGPRYSETWGDPSHQYIPRMDSIMAAQGIINEKFYNLGPTYTASGHVAMTTGFYQEINNGGLELPAYPSIFQHWINKMPNQSSDAWIITSKDKLAVLANCKDQNWIGKYLANTNCGVNGLGTGYRHDSITFQIVMDKLAQYHPRLLLVNFREPDYSGHLGNWDSYLAGIKNTDEYAYQIWNFIQNDPVYKDKTTLFITNDHGRHLDNVGDGFISHGDNCTGCQHINFFACGPDFKKDIVLNRERSLVDIHATIKELLHLHNSQTSGEVMSELFKD